HSVEGGNGRGPPLLHGPLALRGQEPGVRYTRGWAGRARSPLAGGGVYPIRWSLRVTPLTGAPAAGAGDRDPLRVVDSLLVPRRNSPQRTEVDAGGRPLFGAERGGAGGYPQPPLQGLLPVADGRASDAVEECEAYVLESRRAGQGNGLG